MLCGLLDPLFYFRWLALFPGMHQGYIMDSIKGVLYKRPALKGAWKGVSLQASFIILPPEDQPRVVLNYKSVRHRNGVKINPPKLE